MVVVAGILGLIHSGGPARERPRDIRSVAVWHALQLPAPEELYASVIHPQIEIKTKDARDILKKQIQLKNAIKQWG